MIKIALSGRMGSGKNQFLSIADRLFPELKLVEHKFASAIYQVMHNIQNNLEVEKHKDGKLLQFLGSHYRETNSDFWVNLFFRDHKPCNHIITDVRYPNELKACELRNYYTVKLYRQDELRLGSVGNRDIHHISETALDKTSDTNYDYVINNNGSLDLLEGAVHTIISEILRKERS
jgi:hypothetical protein